MKLQTKLILSFSAVAAITLAVAAIGYWQTQKLASALYEVGAVRLPSIQGLDAITEGMTAIRAAEHALLAPNLDETAVAEWTDQERRAWIRVEKGWKLYEPLPQTPEETIKWRAFVPAWRAWQAEHNTALGFALANRLRPDPVLLARAREQSRVADRLARDAARLLVEITAINDAVATAAKMHSVASQQDMLTVQLIMLGTAAIGVAGAIGLGIYLGRRISRPIVQMSEGFAAIARGDLNVHIQVDSKSEIGQAATAMNQMVDALRSAQSTLEVISDNLPNCMIYQLVREIDGTTRFQYLSAGVERLHGVGSEAVLADPKLLFDRVVPEDRATLSAAQQASLSSLTVFNVVVRVRRADGEVRWRHICSQPRRLPDGRVQWDGIEMDITERKQAEEALRQSEAQFRLLVSHSTIGMLLFTSEGIKLEVNPALSRILGYSREELLKLNFTEEITHPADREVTRQYRSRLLAREIDSYEWEKRYITKDGRTVWIHAHVSALRDEHERGDCYISQFQDITARKLAEESLKASAGRLQLALKASRLGIWRREMTGGTAEWDARMFEIYGLAQRGPGPSLEEFLSFVVPEDRPPFQAAWEKLVAGADGYDLQFRIRRRDGELRYLGTQAVVQRNEAGQPVSAIGVVADLTDLVRATEESGRLREKLRQAQKMETLGTLAAGIAHDFNNLLTGINGFVDLGVSTLPPNHEAIELLQQARHGTTSARDLVRRILDFSRRAPDAERTTISLVTFVRNSAPLITSGLPDQVALSFAMEDDAPLVKADPGQIQQILMNLCVNGAHAIGDRGGVITIGLKSRMISPGDRDGAGREIKPGRYACLSVADTGCGMSAEVCARIFEPFYTTKKAGEGTGLGLSVVQDIVVDHSGSISVHSEPGRGTTFEVLLPASDALETPTADSPTHPAARGHGERILVVDDEPSITAVALRALTAAGYRPEVFNSSREAWTHFAASPGRFDLLLTDYQMPDLTGAELAGRVRVAVPALPIVIMTGRVDDLDPAQLLAIGRIDVLIKPFVVDDLLGRMAASLQPPVAASG